MSIIGISNFLIFAAAAAKQDTAINITIPILFLVILGGAIYIWFLTRSMLEYRDKFKLSCSDYRDLSDFLARFTTGIDPNAGIFAPMNTVANYLSDRIGAESIAIYELQEDNMLHCIGVSGAYLLIMTTICNLLTHPRTFYLKTSLLFPLKIHLWSGKMINIFKKIRELEKRVSHIEKALEGIKSLPSSEADTSSYKEVIDEWLNGKKR